MFGFGKRRESARPQLTAVFVSDAGLVCAENQDGVMVSVGRGVFAVADGMGGGAEGAKASGLVCRELNMSLHATEPTFAGYLSAVQNAMVDANYAICTYARERGYATMASTATVLVFDPRDRSRAAIVHVGDCRVYRIRRGMAELLTRDHRVRGGNTLTRAVGASETIRCDLCETAVASGDRFIVCSDGVSSVVAPARLAVFAGSGPLESAAERLAAEVVRCGAPDNYSFILVEA